MRTSIAMRSRSTCKSFPLTGSTCQSFSMALSSFAPATCTVKIVLWPDSERRMRLSCFALTERATESFFPP